ncbi:MAG: response regulator [Bacteroidota bacterium]
MKEQNTILLVDDEPNILLALEFIIKQKGFKVVTAANGSEGIQMARQHLPDLVILDVMMPGLDGFAVAKTIRQDERLNHTTIVFLTAKGTNQDFEQGYASGGEIYLTKPFDNQELLNIISEVFEFG